MRGRWVSKGPCLGPGIYPIMSLLSVPLYGMELSLNPGSALRRVSFCHLGRHQGLPINQIYYYTLLLLLQDLEKEPLVWYVILRKPFWWALSVCLLISRVDS